MDNISKALFILRMSVITLVKSQAQQRAVQEMGLSKQGNMRSTHHIVRPIEEETS